MLFEQHCVTLSPSGNLYDPPDFFTHQNPEFFSAMSQSYMYVQFPRKNYSLMIPGKISRFLKEFCFSPETALVRVVTPYLLL